MSQQDDGLVSVGVIAGTLTATTQPINPRIGKQFFVGKDRTLSIHITPDIARQWITELQTITEEQDTP